MTDLHCLSAQEWEARLAGSGVATSLHSSLGRFLELFGRWSRVVDLTARADAEAIIKEDIEGSLTGAAYLPKEGALLDIGSGSGFPAIPLLLASPGLRGVLLEPRERRWAFLREAVRDIGLSAVVLRDDVQGHSEGNYDVVTVRGVSEEPWRPVLPRLLARGGVLLWWSHESAAARASEWPGGCVLTSAGVPAGRGRLVVWRRCFT